MAKENIAGFLDAAMRDKALAEKFAALAAEQGYVFTAEELLELGEARPLSDADIENAAGGARPLSWAPLRPEKIDRSDFPLGK